MKHIVGMYGTITVLVLNLCICIAITNASIAVIEAKEYKAAVIAEIENSNFNQNVISACVEQARKVGYQLEIVNCIYDDRNDIQTAEIVLTYELKIPLFRIAERKSTRGIAR